MDEVKFRNWMLDSNMNKKVCGDIISRLKRIELQLNYLDLDEEYSKDGCQYLLSLFKNNGLNKEMKKYSCNLPLGKGYMSTYKYAINKYIKFKDLNS